MTPAASELAERCRARIAARWQPGWPPPVLGGITLRDAQREAAARVGRLLDRYRGCLLADDVGRGKTFVALATARRWAHPLVVAPATLCDTWRLAMSRAGVSCALVTHESLSRGREPPFVPDGVIVDESHHFRNPATRRHAVLAWVAREAELLLLSATPVQNATTDLVAQLMLFLGTAAAGLPDQALAAFVVRAEADDAEAGLPAVDPPAWIPLHADDSDILHAILDLPAPPRALDAGDAGVLRTISLVRAWASSHAALRSAIARRRRTALAVEQCLDSGRVPSRAELRSWQGDGEEAVQLGFPALLAAHQLPGLEGEHRLALRAGIEKEHAALARLSSLLRDRRGIDLARAQALRRVVRDHPRERVIAFTGLASTATAYYGMLRDSPGVGLLTASGATIASGRITRRELMARFAPSAHGYPEPPLRERVTLLVSTDLLSEGVNLQDASVVVHLDLPWNPARLAQRVGRVRRPNGASRVRALLLAPPAATERIIEVEQRLRHKLADAERMVGRSIDVVPALTLGGGLPRAAQHRGVASHRAAIDRRLHDWRRAQLDGIEEVQPIVGAACSTERGWLALLDDGYLVASVDGCVGDDVVLLDRAVAAAAGDARSVDDAERRDARMALRAFLERERLLADCGVRELVAPMARTVLRHAARRFTAVPRHERARATSALARLRRALARPCPLGAERALCRLVDEGASLASIDWLERAVAALPASARSADPAIDPVVVPGVLLLFGPLNALELAEPASSRAEEPD